MIWVIVIGIVAYVLFKFFSDLNKDNYDLQGQSLDEKFGIIVGAINEVAFDGYGTVTPIDKRRFNLYKDGQNQIVHFDYSTGNLRITWKYKYFQKEVFHEKQFNNVRNLSIFEQQKIADVMIAEMSQIVENHINDVLRDAF